MLMRQTLDYVFSNAERNNPKSILQTIDNFVLESGQFLMNVGPEKGEILKNHLLKSEPNNVIELGTFIGYSAVLISSTCLLYTSPSPRDKTPSRMPSSA